MSIKLLSSTTRVETPFISVQIGDFVFGIFNQSLEKIIQNNKLYSKVVSVFPNFMQSLSVTKVNGAVNTYTLNMEYKIRAGDDPNLIDKALSSVSKTRKIKLSYGDYSTPTYFFREESAIITKVTSSVNVAASSITYNINCTSEALSLTAGTYSFSKKYAKPSDEIKRILYDKTYGVLEVFYGMRDKNLILAKGLIAGDDRPVNIEAQRNITIFNYLNYLVTCMSNVNDSDSELIKKNRYTLTVYDDLSNEFGGPYFKVTKVTDNIPNNNSLDTYEIDIGYPGENIVTGFSITNNETYSILYDYSKQIHQADYSYRIDNNGEVGYIYAPVLSNSPNLMKTTEADKTWWTSMTQYPISAQVTVKGLLRPAILMSYVKLNVLFFGRKHTSSGYYIITKQQDTVDSSGYRTTLYLTRIKGDPDEYEYFK